MCLPCAYHVFTVTVEKLKAFLTILLVSEYAGLTRQVSRVQTIFTSGCDNKALNSSDKFAKVRQLLTNNAF